MMKDIIEFKRQQLYQTIGLVGLTSDETLKVSQELESLMNFHSKVNRPYTLKRTNQAMVHNNFIYNILDVSSKEKLELPFGISENILATNDWFRIDFANTLLEALSERHGAEVLEAIGEAVPVHCIFPDTVQSFEQSLLHLNHIFHLNHKSSSYIGEYLPFMDIKNEIQLFCHTPDYSSSFNYGIIKGLAKKFNQPLKMKVIDNGMGGQFKIIG
ncbi:Spo0E family sporulation regulatory protein-aspartic acid phosphatase [Bacillus sp. 1P10SD]|uniref:aspartyl-phosphate phosphatase Spo0E family protein n=1 Tax=Bacillus sp. 1P10SD TaxID=3132265 RepID=UPI0039A5AEE8